MSRPPIGDEVGTTTTTMEDVFVDASTPTLTTAAERLVALHAWQRHYNMEPRTDSRLTQLYVDGELDWPVDVVARELVATDFIFQNTLYGEVIQEFMRGVAYRLRSTCNLSWTSTWQIVRFYAPIALKLLLLDRTGLRIPAYLPPAATSARDTTDDADAI